MSSDCLIKGKVHLLKKLLSDAVNILHGQNSDRGNRNACSTSFKVRLLLELLLFSLIDQLFHRRSRIVSIKCVICRHPCETGWEDDQLELCHDDFNLLLAFVPNLFDLVFFESTPIPALASLVLPEEVVELAHEVLVGALSEHDFELLNAVVVGLRLALFKELENFLPLHAKASLEDVLQIAVEFLNLLRVSVLKLNSKVVGQVTQLTVQHILNLVLLRLCRGSRHLREHLVFAALSQSLKLLLQVGRVKCHCLVPPTLLDH